MTMGYGQYSDNSRGRNNPLRDAASDKPRREVFPTEEIPHKWAHQTQTRARNAQGNLFFDGPTIFSYRTSWPLARIYTRKGKPFPHGLRGSDSQRAQTVTLVLTNSEKYSVTTAGHQHAVNRAAQHLPCVAVPIPSNEHYGRSDWHARNIAHLIESAAACLKKAQRAYSVRAVEWAASDARAAIASAGNYLHFFGIRRKPPVYPGQAWADAYARAQRIENLDPASADRRERASARRRERAQQAKQRANERRYLIEIPCARTSWRLYNTFGMSVGGAHGPVMLRLQGDEIETSMGARIPAAHAARLWRVVQRVRASGVPYQHNGHSEHAGDYRVDRIETDGTLRAGCHTIPFSELAAMARALGLS